ncbi:MFS transporter [Streptomyces sp. 4N509B]|uniref:MFS transporter n=1 Tax=Streptomyces sp. 4N509B TaxID=3457413 RepID=UPI003FD43F65
MREDDGHENDGHVGAAGTGGERAAAPGRGRVGAAATLAAVMVSASLMQFALGALAPFLQEEFGLDHTGLGLVVACYYLAASGLSPVMGRLTGAVGGWRGMLVAASLGAAGTAVTAAATTLAGLLVGIVLAGAAAATANPATNLSIVGMRPPHAALVGVKQAGVQAAAFLAGATLPAVALGASWRVALVCCTAWCVLSLPLLAWSGGRLGRGGGPPRGDAPAGRRATRGPLVRLGCFAALMGAGAAGLNTFLVVYAHEEIGVDVRVAGAQFALVGLVAMGSRVAWPLLADRSPRPAHRGMVLLRLCAAGAAVAVGLVLLAKVAGPAALWGAAAFAGLSSASWNGLAMLVVMHLSGPVAVARASARVQGAFFLGLMLSPLVFGALADRFGGHAYGWLWCAACFLTATLVLRPRAALAAGPGGDGPPPSGTAAAAGRNPGDSRSVSRT